MSGFGIGVILDFSARVRRYGSRLPGGSQSPGRGCAVTRNATVSGFGTANSRRFSRKSSGWNGFGEKNREKMRVEGEVFREPKAEIGRNERIQGFQVRLFGSGSAHRCRRLADVSGFREGLRC